MFTLGDRVRFFFVEFLELDEQKAIDRATERATQRLAFHSQMAQQQLAALRVLAEVATEIEQSGR